MVTAHRHGSLLRHALRCVPWGYLEAILDLLGRLRLLSLKTQQSTLLAQAHLGIFDEKLGADGLGLHGRLLLLFQVEPPHVCFFHYNI